MVTPNCRVGTGHTSWYIKGAELTSKRTKEARGIGQQEPMKFNQSKCQVSPQGGKSTCDNTSWGERGWGVALPEGLWSGSGQWVAIVAKMPSMSWAIWIVVQSVDKRKGLPPCVWHSSDHIQMLHPVVDFNTGKTWPIWSTSSEGP